MCEEEKRIEKRGKVEKKGRKEREKRKDKQKEKKGGGGGEENLSNYKDIYQQAWPNRWYKRTDRHTDRYLLSQKFYFGSCDSDISSYFLLLLVDHFKFSLYMN